MRAAGFGWEIAWQESRRSRAFTEHDLLKETAWVILCSGFREATVRKAFDYISLCYCDWESATEICRHRDLCIATASARFHNPKKLGAIARVAELIEGIGFDGLRDRISREPIAALQEFPFIGPITSWHLAKNLGLDVAKNDRHLARVALELGYADAHSLCGDLAKATGHSVSVVDIVLWRYSALTTRRSKALAPEPSGLARYALQ